MSPLPARENDAYVAWRPLLPEPELKREDTALLVVDMQFLDAHPDYGMLRSVRQSGFQLEFLDLSQRLETVIIPNIRRLQVAMRQAGAEVIHTRIQSMTADGRDRGASHKKMAMVSPPNSMEAQILPELEPLPGELVFSKTAGSVFNSTNIEYVLRNMGIRNLIVTGVVTTGCVHTAVTDAVDKGFNVILVEDGCGAIVHDMHLSAVRVLRDVYCKVMSTNEVLTRINSLAGAALPVG